MSVPKITGVQLSEPSAGPLLVLGPSLGTSATALWAASAAFLGERFHVVAWDLPGHGQTPTRCRMASPWPSSPPACWHSSTVLTDRGESGGPLVYAGDSVGGAVGLQLCWTRRTGSLAAVLLCTGAKIGDADGWRERAARVRASGTAVLVSQSVERWFAPGFLEREPEVASAPAVLYAPPTRRLRPGLRGACRLRRTRPAGEIAVPVLAVAGAEDVADPAGAARRDRGRRPARRTADSRRGRTPGAGRGAEEVAS